MWGWEGQQWRSLLLLLPDRIQAHRDALALFGVRTRTTHKDQRRPSPATSHSWAFVKAFGVLCGYLGQPPSVDIFLHFFEVKNKGKSLWVSLSSIAGRVIFSLFQQSYKGWKRKFFKVCCSNYDHAALDDFPLYWVEEVKLTKPKSLDELPSTDREVCQILASVGTLDTSILISREYDVEALAKYISMRVTPPSLLFSTFACFLLGVWFICSSCVVT